MDKRFNIRAYGIWIHNNQLLVNEELIRGKIITKLPGGGLDWKPARFDVSPHDRPRDRPC